MALVIFVGLHSPPILHIALHLSKPFRSPTLFTWALTRVNGCTVLLLISVKWQAQMEYIRYSLLLYQWWRKINLFNYILFYSKIKEPILLLSFIFISFNCFVNFLVSERWLKKANLSKSQPASQPTVVAQPHTDGRHTHSVLSQNSSLSMFKGPVSWENSIKKCPRCKSIIRNIKKCTKQRRQEMTSMIWVEKQGFY